MPPQRCLTDCGRVRADHAHPKDDGDGTGDSDGIGKGDGITEKAVFGVLRQQEATVEVLWDVEIQTPGQPTEQVRCRTYRGSPPPSGVPPVTDFRPESIISGGFSPRAEEKKDIPRLDFVPGGD